VSTTRFPDESSPRLPDPAASNTGLPRDRHANLFPGFGSIPYVKPPIFVDYGANVHIGGTTFINRNCHILDTPVASIEVGERCLFGPNVHLYGVTHTLDAGKRSDPSYDASSLAGDIKIGNDCWIGGNATILPGVTIGDGSVIGAGSVVTRDVPAHHLAVGVPARVMRRLDQSGNENNGSASRLFYAIMQLWKSRSALPRLGRFSTMRSLEAKLIGLECTVFILVVVIVWLLYLEVTRFGG
jgi:acetyltransferase-like isoleucine patch superfamily enzyme